MSGTNFPTGLVTRKKYSGNTATPLLASGAASKAIRKTAVIRCLGDDADNTEVTTDFTFPAKCVVHAVYLNVITLDDTETVDVGTAGTSDDPDGFLDGASLATAGLVKGTLLNTGQTLGALLRVDEGGTAELVPEASIAVGGDPLTYTCSAGTDTADFDIIVEYTEIVEENS